MNKIEVNTYFEITSASYHDFSVHKLFFEGVSGEIILKSGDNSIYTKFHIEDIIEYGINYIFSDSIVGEAFYVSLNDICDKNIVHLSNEILKNKFYISDGINHLRELNINNNLFLFQMRSIDGGSVSSICRNASSK